MKTVFILRLSGKVYYIFIPPSTWITCPDTYEDISEAKNTAMFATSSGVPPRRNGIRLFHSALTSSDSLAVISVMMNPMIC